MGHVTMHNYSEQGVFFFRKNGSEIQNHAVVFDSGDYRRVGPPESHFQF